MIKTEGIQKRTGQITNPRRASRKAGPQLNTGCCKAHRVPMVAALGPVWQELIKATSEGLKQLPSHCLLLCDERRSLVVHRLTPQPPGKFIQRSFCHFSLANKSTPCCPLNQAACIHHSPLSGLTSRLRCLRRMEKQHLD